LYAEPIQRLIDELSRLPGIGPKSAQRVAFHLLKVNSSDAARLSEAIAEVKAKVRLCRLCFNVSDQELCEYCRDPRRDGALVCVVQDPPDIVAIERTREFRGLYHVLQGAISPIEGIGPEDLRVAELLDRLKAPPEGRARVARPAASPWAATSSTRTRSRWGGPWRAGGPSGAENKSRYRLISSVVRDVRSNAY
jgi:recombination protein RecR